MKKHYYSRLVLAIFNHLIWITHIWIATQAEIRRQAWNDEIWTNIQVNAVVCRRFVIIRRNFVPISFHSSEMMFCSLLVDQFNPMERINVVYRTFMASNYQKTMPNNISSTLLLVWLRATYQLIWVFLGFLSRTSTRCFLDFFIRFLEDLSSSMIIN